jgi:hypothetical protein
MKGGGVNLLQIAKTTGRRELYWLGGKKEELDVYEIPTEHLYFNIENGRYADSMLRLRREHAGKQIDPKQEKWKAEIEKMLTGEHRETNRDKSAFQRLVEDITDREQLRPGVVLRDGGVLDGNRRLAALRVLQRHPKTKNPAKYSRFFGVILPDETSDIDRWKIEAGLQLGMNERWDYPPVNELLKVRQGIQMYEDLARRGKLPTGADPYKLVADAIFGKTKDDIREMSERLDLIDQYLEFIEKDGAYDLIGKASEQWLEATRIMRAVRNQSRDPAFIARIRAALFYTVNKDLMDNYELRDIYKALGGDPKSRGRRTTPDEKALADWLSSFPDNPKAIQRKLLGKEEPATKVTPSKKPTAKAPPAPAPKALKGGKPTNKDEDDVDESAIEAKTEHFKRRMAAKKNNRNSARKFAEGALADMQNLEKFLDDDKNLSAITKDERGAVRDALKKTGNIVKTCQQVLDKK